MFNLYAKINDIAVKEINLKDDFHIDIESTIKAIDDKNRLLFLCSPGNPTSVSIPINEIESLLKFYKNGIIIVDEAYIDFSNAVSAITLVEKYPNIVIIQTLSKSFGLAGIRLSTAIAQGPIIQLMNTVKPPYNINKLTADLASRLFNDLSEFEYNLNNIIYERSFLSEELVNLPFVKKVYPSETNFILFRIPKSLEICNKLAKKDIFCRYKGLEVNCSECLRVTVGTRPENEAFIKGLKIAARELNIV